MKWVNLLFISFITIIRSKFSFAKLLLKSHPKGKIFELQTDPARLQSKTIVFRYKPCFQHTREVKMWLLTRCHLSMIHDLR